MGRSPASRLGGTDSPVVWIQMGHIPHYLPDGGVLQKTWSTPENAAVLQNWLRAGSMPAIPSAVPTLQSSCTPTGRRQECPRLGLTADGNHVEGPQC